MRLINGLGGKIGVLTRRGVADPLAGMASKPRAVRHWVMVRARHGGRCRLDRSAVLSRGLTGWRIDRPLMVVGQPAGNQGQHHSQGALDDQAHSQPSRGFVPDDTQRPRGRRAEYPG